MTLYMTVLCICFKYYLCSIGFPSSLKIKIIIYFGHCFPLTSHIRGASVINPNGTSPSECRHFLCWHTKEHLWIEGCLKHYRWACYEIHWLSIQLAIFTFEYVNCCTRLFVYTTRVHMWLFLLHVAYYTRVFVIATCVQICTRASLKAIRVSYAGFQY